MKPHIVLDLDNTLISAEALTDFPFHNPVIKEKALQFAIHDMDGYYIVFERPGVQNFLDFLFTNYHVSIWTAASKDYALFIIDRIILTKPDRTLKYILFSYHCDLSRQMFKKSKDLRLIWDTMKLPTFSRSNTVIIDDLSEVHHCQPNNSIHIPAFEILNQNSEYDQEMLNMMIMVPETLKQLS
jgi:TFIIF-interacting CTD phosphatase-like protein